VLEGMRRVGGVEMASESVCMGGGGVQMEYCCVMLLIIFCYRLMS
jgi:hypothetical protein